MKNMYFSNIYLCFVLFALFGQCQCEKYKITDQIYMDVKIGEVYQGRITFGLFGEVVPKTVKNFKHLALYGINGRGYNGTKFVVAIRKVMILGGDVVFNNGTGSTSIYGDFFEDESFEIKHESSGLLVMANAGVPNSNGCTFFITTMATPWLNGKYVVFGKVLRGNELVHKIEYLKTDYNDRILEIVQIIDIGEIQFTPYYEDHKNFELTFWAWIKAGWFPLSFSFGILGFFHYFIAKLNTL